MNGFMPSCIPVIRIDGEGKGIDGEGKESMAKERNLSACKAFRVFHCVLHSLAVFEIDVVRRLKSSMACNLGKYQGQSDFREMMRWSIPLTTALLSCCA